MAQRKGQTGNPNGRPKGKPNKVTASMKDWIQQLIDGSRTQLEADLQALDPRERWMVVEKLMGYTLPKMSSVEANVDLTRLSDDQLNRLIDELLNNIDHANRN